MTLFWNELISFTVSGMITVFIITIALIGIFWLINRLVLLTLMKNSSE